MVCVCVCDAVHAPGSRLRWGLLLRAGSLSRRHLLENSSFCVTPSRGGVRVHFPVAGAAVLGVSLIRLDRFVYVRVCTVTLHPLLSITPMAGSACSLFLREKPPARATSMYPNDRVYCTLYFFSVYLLRIVLFSFIAPLLLSPSHPCRMLNLTPINLCVQRLPASHRKRSNSNAPSLHYAVANAQTHAHPRLRCYLTFVAT